MVDFSKMEYGDSNADDILSIYNNSVEKALHPDSVDANSRNCNESSHVDFLYLSTIRGGRKMRKGGGCGCNMTGGDEDLDIHEDINEGEYNEGENNNMNDNVEDIAISGGCFKCKKGVKNIIHIYRSVHIIIPTLYSKYKKGISMKEKKIKKPLNPKPINPKKPKTLKNKK